jgi:hypothetical protein
MSNSEIRAKLINTRGAAIAALCVTLFLAARQFWSIVERHTDRPEWIYPLNSWLPNWLAITGNIFTYGLFGLSLVTVVRTFEGAERVILAILIAEVLISPIRQFVPHLLSEAILCAQAFGSLAMFFAAIHLFLCISEKIKGRG